MSEVTFDREIVPIDFKVRLARVVGVVRSPGFTRVWLSGPELFELELSAPEMHAKLVLPNDDGSAPTFIDDAGARPRPTTPVRDMTIAVSNDDVLAIDIAEHESGPTMDWLAKVEPGGWGSEVALMGPRKAALLPRAPRVILGADASAVPALNRWLSSLPDETIVDVILDSPAGSDVQNYLVERQCHSVTVISSGTDGEYVAALADLDPDERTYVWLAGEASGLVAPRRWLRGSDSRVDRSNVKVMGYWKVGISGRDHHEPIDPTDID